MKESKLRQIIREEIRNVAQKQKKVSEANELKMVYMLGMRDLVQMYAENGQPSEYGYPYEGPFSSADEAFDELEFSGFQIYRSRGLPGGAFALKSDEPSNVYMVGRKK